LEGSDSGDKQMSYVGHTTVDREQLLKLLEQCSGDRFFFLRSTHQVSGILSELPPVLSPEGQVFNSQIELRWKAEKQRYRVLLLSRDSELEGFKAIAGDWETEDHPALLHDRRTPQYPNRFVYPSGLEKRIQQRYFRDRTTGIVHFVALTVKKNGKS
jgi:hypothetical protein